MRILLAEDNPIVAEGLVTLLRGSGYAVDLVGDGLSADLAIAAENFDLVILDLNLPEMDGLEATRIIRANSGKQPQIVAMTANAMPEDREVCLQAGMDDYISKPINLDTLIGILKKAAEQLIS